MPGDLLEIITSRLEKSSISDLRFTSATELLAGIKNMDLTEYAIKEWDYVLSYIFDDSINVESYDEIITKVKKINE